MSSTTRPAHGGLGHGDRYEGLLYIVGVSGTATQGEFLGRPVEGERFTLTYAISFDDPAIQTDGQNYLSYRDQEPITDTVILSARVGRTELETLVERTSGPEEYNRTLLQMSDDNPFAGSETTDGLIISTGGLGGGETQLLSSTLIFTNPTGDFTDRLSFDQRLSYRLEGEDTADLTYSNFDLTTETLNWFAGPADSISLNAVPPRRVFEWDNLAELGYPAGKGCLGIT